MDVSIAIRCMYTDTFLVIACTMLLYINNDQVNQYNHNAWYIILQPTTFIISHYMLCAVTPLTFIIFFSKFVSYKITGVERQRDMK